MGRRSTRSIPGFDYRTDKPVEDTLDGWRETLERIVKEGGRVKKHEGETWGIGKNHIIQVEIYENIKLKEA